MQLPNTATKHNPFKFRCPHCGGPLLLTRHSPVFHCRACDTWGPNTRWVRRRAIGCGSGYTSVKPRPYRPPFERPAQRRAIKTRLWALPSLAMLATVATAATAATAGLLAF